MMGGEADARNTQRVRPSRPVRRGSQGPQAGGERLWITSPIRVVRADERADLGPASGGVELASG